MPYVKISDPNIIDLSAWHQVINVVNQHSDSLNAITNNFGVQGSGAVDVNSTPVYALEYNPGAFKMLYGRTKINTADASHTTGKHMFYIDVDFSDSTSGTTGFSARPIITATAYFGSTVTPPPVTDANIAVTVIAANTDGFTVRVVDTRSTPTNPVELTGYFYINWTAIGPR